MKATSKVTEQVHSITLEMTDKEIDQVMAVLRNGTSTILHYHPAAVHLYNALIDAGHTGPAYTEHQKFDVPYKPDNLRTAIGNYYNPAPWD